MKLILIIATIIVVSGCAPSKSKPSVPIDADLPDLAAFLDPQIHVMPETAKLILTAEPVSFPSATNILFRFRDVKVLKGVLEPELVDEEGFLALELYLSDDAKVPTNAIAIYATPRQNQDSLGHALFRRRYLFTLSWQGLSNERIEQK